MTVRTGAVVAGLGLLLMALLSAFGAGVVTGLAMLAAWLRVVYAAAFVAAPANLFVAVRAATERRTEALLSVETFQDGWDVALLVFGVHLALVGYLIVKATYIPTWIGLLVALAGAGYLVDGVGRLMISGYDLSVAAVTFIGEVVLLIWLLWQGRSLEVPPMRLDVDGEA